MSTKRLRILTLLLALLLPLLAACGGGEGGETTTTPSAAASADAAVPSVAVPEASMMASAEASMMASTEASMMASTEASAAGGAEASTEAAASTAATAGAGTAAEEIDWTALQVEDGATLRVASWGDPSEQAINQEAFERFKQVFPNVTINYEPSPDQYQTKIQADFAASTNPDVMYIDTALLNQLAPNGQLLDLKPYLDQVGVSQEDYLGELAGIFVQDGKVYGLPKDFNPLLLFVRNDLAEKAGVDPASIKTWDDWKAAAQKMTADGVFGQCSSYDPQRVAALWLQKGVEPVKDNKAQFTDPKAVEATQFWYSFMEDKIATLPRELGADWCGQSFGQGQTAMALEGGWMLPYLAKDFADVQYTALPIPTPPDGEQDTLVFTNAWGAAANSKFPNAAAALALFLTSPQNQQPIAQTGFALPTVKALLEDPYFQENANAKVALEGGQYGTSADIVFGGPKKDDVIKPLSTALEALWTGGGDVAQVQQQANEEAQAVLDAQ